jgi:hypothetical protein
MRNKSTIPQDSKTPITRVVDALERAGCAPRGSGNEWRARCPGHNSRGPSLSVRVGEDGRVLMHCFAGCDLESILQALGLSISELFASDQHGVSTTGPLRGAPKPTPRDKPFPPEHQVLALWRQCRRMDQDLEASAWATARGLDPFMIADRNLCRVLPTGVVVPDWAYLGGDSWPQGGYRLVLPLYDASGAIASLHARNVRLDASPKCAFPCGYAAAGLVLADDAGRMMLRTAHLYGALWIPEGVPDFLSCATGWGDAAEDSAPAILGVVAGSWTSVIAKRVPDGTVVVIAVHHDTAGEKYRAAITTSLAGRCVLKRWMPKGMAS